MANAVGDRARAQRGAVHRAVCGLQTGHVALDHFYAGHQVMSQHSGLRRLGVGVGWQHRIAVLFRQAKQGGSQGEGADDDAEDFAANDHPVQGDRDVVPAASRMQSRRDVGITTGREALFNMVEEVFAGAIETGRAKRADVQSLNRRQEGARVVSGQDLLLREHGQVRAMDLDQLFQKVALKVREVDGQDGPGVRRIGKFSSHWALFYKEWLSARVTTPKPPMATPATRFIQTVNPSDS